ncbi:hypothetical protein P4O66_010650 [Electrophorus voltai]|uniref:SH2 domain-containing protein n=1 Tax=Electrophorus voltai TaxID=2609070 RepID=A0AAD8ZCK6_9TELE|nr:hypothetical protein P4O66_010650 [Electrophorus voltai]
MEIAPKTKYTPFRSGSFSSADETTSNLSLPSSAPPTPLTPPGIPSSLSSSSLAPMLPPVSPRPAENSPTTLCSFFPRMGALRLGMSATLLPGLKASSRSEQAAGPLQVPAVEAVQVAPAALSALPLTAPSPPPRPPQDMNRLGGASRRARVEGGQLGGDEWTRHGSFVNKPTRGWLHSDNVVSTTGVSYAVRVMWSKSQMRQAGMCPVRPSCPRTLHLLSVALGSSVPDPPTPSNRACDWETEQGPGGARYSRRRCLDSFVPHCEAHKSNIIANHHMQSISFASGGDPSSMCTHLSTSPPQDTAEYVAYVAKDPVNQRGKDPRPPITAVAPYLAGDACLSVPTRPNSSPPHDRMAPFDGSAWEEEDEDLAPPPEVPHYNNFPGKQPPPGGLVDMRTRPGHSTGPTLPYGQPGMNDIHKQPLPPLPVGAKDGGLFDDPSYVNVDKPRPPVAASNGSANRDAFDMSECKPSLLLECGEPFDDALGGPCTAVLPLAEQLQNESWFHGPLSRRQAERLLSRDGDFLVRESGTTPGQYVLTGQQGDQPKHLLLVDPEGVVRTKDHRFESVSHLISYHMDNRLPIVSAGSDMTRKSGTVPVLIHSKETQTLGRLLPLACGALESFSTQERSQAPSCVRRLTGQSRENRSDMDPQGPPLPHDTPSSLDQELRDAARKCGRDRDPPWGSAGDPGLSHREEEVRDVRSAPHLLRSLAFCACWCAAEFAAGVKGRMPRCHWWTSTEWRRGVCETSTCDWRRSVKGAGTRRHYHSARAGTQKLHFKRFTSLKESGLEAQGQGDSTGSAKLPSEQLGPGSTRRPELPDSHAEETPGPEPPQVRPLEAGEDVAPLTADPLLSAGSPVESLSSLTSDSSERSPSHHGEGHHLPDPDGETFSDSFEPTSPAPDHDAATCGEEISQEVEKSELRRTLSEEESKLGCETEEKVSEGSGVRKRNISLLTPHRDDDEDEELLEEHFQPPPRADGFGVSLNKCIFGALLLLALGTVFFSGKHQPRRIHLCMTLINCWLRVVFLRWRCVVLQVCSWIWMADGWSSMFVTLTKVGSVSVGLSCPALNSVVGDVDVGDLTEAVLQKEWLNPDAPTETPAAVQHSELLERLAKDSEQIANLQARLQQQEERLRAAQFQVEEESKERKRREELEVENQRMKEELERLLALQKQLEQETQRLKKVSEGPEEDLQGLPAMQKALEVLRNMADISQNKKAPVVPSAEGEARAHHRGKEPEDARVQEKEQKNELKKARKGKVEVEKPRVQRGGEKRNGKKRGEQEKEEGKGEGKAEREKTRGKMGDEGKGWKEGGEKRKFKHDGGKGDRKDGRKEKLGAVDSGRKGPGNKVKEDEEWKHGSEEKGWKHRKEWKKVNEAGRNEWKEQREGKKSEKREQEGGEKRGGGRKENLKDGGKPDKVQKEKLGKGKKDHHKGNGEKVQKDWEEKHRNVREQDWTGEAWTDVKRSKDEHHQKGQKWSRKDKPGHGSLDKASHHSQHIHDDYWNRQRDRIRHYRGSMEGCTGIMACAHAEGLNPVSQNEFESLFLGYLSRVLGTAEQASKKGELNKLVGEFFTDGVFVHDQIPFSEFVEDMADILEDVAEDEGNEEMEDEMEGFAREAMEKFALPDRRGNVEKRKGVSG